MTSERMQRQIDRFLDEAERAVAESDWRLVVARCEQVLALDPENVDARAYRAAAQRGLTEAVGEGTKAAETPGPRASSPSPEDAPAGEMPALPAARAEALAHLDFAIAELREMKMQPALERALRHKEILKA